MSADHQIQTAGIVGSGTMGTGIAMAYANGGIPVTLVDTDPAALERGLATIRSTYDRAVDRGRMEMAEAEERIAMITGSGDLGDLAGADIVTEAVFEDMGVKLELIGKLDAVLPATTIVASNTSTLDIDEMAAASAHPGRVLGMHYFSPANVMKLLEIVRGAQTDPEVLARTEALARDIGKVPVTVGVCFGFVGNRMLFARAAQSELLLLEGSTPLRNDAAMTAFGFPMGQHSMMDLSGLDVEWRIRQPRGEVRPLSDKLVEMNRLGQKTGAGYYRYEKGSRAPVPDPEVEALCREIGQSLGHQQRDFDETYLLERQLFPLVNEGVRILEAGLADNAGDIDTIWQLGFGWPGDKGGPMVWAEEVGAERLRDRLNAFADETGDESLRPAASIDAAAASGRKITDEIAAKAA